MDEHLRRAGRPTKPAAPGTRASLGLRVTGQIKQRLDAAARANGRTQSQEAEARLERSFQEERLLPQLMEAAYGRHLAGLLLLLGKPMHETTLIAAFDIAEADGDDVMGPTPSLFNDPRLFEQVSRCANHILAALRPAGSAMTAARDVGTARADAALHALGNLQASDEAHEWTESVRRLLGPIVERVVKGGGAAV